MSEQDKRDGGEHDSMEEMPVDQNVQEELQLLQQ